MPKPIRKELVQKPGYHISPIPKGKLGQSSKILEEVLELIDAEKQGCMLMALLELSDIIGAMRAYLAAHARGLTFDDLAKMSDITKRAFDNGHRK